MLAPSRGSDSSKPMRRLTATLTLLFAFAGNLIPVALAATLAPPRACCLRKGVRHCPDSQTSESEQLAIRDARCCNQDCRRAVTTSQWAHPQSQAAAFFLQTITASQSGTELNSPANPSAEFRPSRAPPAC